MIKISVRRRIGASVSEVWKHISDFSNIAKFNPMLAGSDFNSDIKVCEVGSSRKCDMKDGNYLKERIITWKEGSHYKVEIYETSMPIIKAATVFGVSPVSEYESEAYMHFGILPKSWYMGPMVFLMFKFVVGPGILRGLEKYMLKNQPELSLV